MGENVQFYYYIQPETMETYIKIIQTVQSHSARLAPPPQLTDVHSQRQAYLRVNSVSKSNDIPLIEPEQA